MTSLGADSSLIGALESRLVNAWPSFEIEIADGWLLRFAEGYSKRANSASPLLPGARLDAELVRHIAATFDSRGLPACFRLNGLEDPGTDDVLAAEGYVPYDPSLCLVAPLGTTGELDGAVVLRPVAKPRWVAAAAASYGGDKANADILGRIVRAIHQPSAFATLLLDGEDAAWAFAVAERGFVGIYDVVVAPNLRGLGLGRRLVTSLMTWGARQGATKAYLQMRETNTVAHGLYRALGYETAYRYTHRVPPGDPEARQAAGAPERAGA